jgi:YVTN family beta-propeller protein
MLKTASVLVKPWDVHLYRIKTESERNPNVSRMRRLPGVRLLLAAGALVLPPHGLHADEQERLQVGQQPDGRVVVPTNQVLQPAGVQVLFPGRPVDLALLDGGRTLVVKNLKDLVFIDVATGKVRQTLASPVGFSVVGLLAHEQHVYVTDVKEHLRVAARNAEGRYGWKDPVELGKPRAGGSVHPAGVAAHSADAVWVASTRGNSVQLVNVTTGKVEQVVGVGVAPYAICRPRPGLCYVSNWGGDPPREGDARAPSAGTPARVDDRGIASQGTVSVLEQEGGTWRQVKTIPVGLHPSGMVASPDGGFVYVANANSDTVSVIRTDTHAVAETIPCRSQGRLPFGSGCNALALDPGGKTLYVANGTNNCLAVVRLGARACRPADAGAPQDSQLLGLIPTGWYPGAVLVSADGKRLFVANVKGVGSLSRRRTNDREPRPEAKGRNSHDHLGSVSLIDVPDAAQLTRYTEAVNANNRLAYSLAGLEKPRPEAEPVPVPERHGEPSIFQHVIYVIKENRTYDQVFGDMKEGNGDPNLVLFGADVTPNHHALARQFTLFDNFYCSGVLSADGHQWVNEAYVTDYLEKAFGGFTRSYPYEGSDPLAFASSGFLWDNALARQKTFRNFGEFVKRAAPKGATWADMYQEYRTGAGKFQVEARANVARLGPFTHPGYPGFVLSIPDVYRAKLFLEELKACERKGEFPNLVYLYLPCDHTNGTRPNFPTPRAMVADNDLALGQVVEAVSHSRFWPRTCLFVVEDDPQNGFDHVDAHRTVALVISPYTRRRFVDSTCYNQTGMVKTIELLLGLPPMNQLDLSATALRQCFQGEPDLTPYRAVKNQIALDEMNPPLKELKGQALYWARKSLELNLDEADQADEDTFNRILWHATRGEAAPYPERFAGSR